VSERFGDVEIDAEAFRVTRAGVPVRLEPKAVQLVLLLASKPGRLVTKAEIQDAVWPGTFVTENALTRLVAQVRKGLGDDAKESRYVETVPTLGYRWVAAPSPVPEAGSGPRGQSEQATEATAAAGPGGLSLVVGRRRSSWVAASAAVAAGLVLGVAALALSRVVRTQPAVTSRGGDGTIERQVSTAATLNVFPRFSPDGSSIAFATLRGGSMEIVVRALALGAREVAVTADGQQNVQPAFSPDGRLLAFHSVGRGGIWLLPALGGVSRQLTAFGSNPAWSPDGSTIAFQGQSWVGASAAFSAAGEGSTLWLVPVSGGEPRRLTSIDDVGPGGQGGPAWSPDGRLVTFVAGMRVFSVRSDGTGLRQTSRGLWGRDVVWERSGRTQLWCGSRQGNWFVWRMPVDPGTAEPTGEPEVLAGGGEKDSAWTQPALSPDGRTMAYVRFRTTYEILAQPVSPSGDPRGSAVGLAAAIAGRKTPPLFSPDGRSLAFGTQRPGVGESLWVAPLGAGEPRLLLERPGLWGRTWFPGGRRLGFVHDEGGHRSFQSVDLDTGLVREHRRLEPHVTSAPRLSPDGTRLAAHGALRGGINVWLMDLDGGAARRLTHDREGVGWPVWSPDGESLAVELMRSGTTRVGVMSARGGPVRELTTAPGQSWPFSFSPDGRRVAFAGQRGGIWNIYTVSVDGGDERPVSAYASPSRYVRYPDWAPSGDRIAYESADSTSTVWVREIEPPSR
jgi:Tol biopolymer transport system component/DNA-binding winged helix-turn-helix (wHTH) protein